MVPVLSCQALVFKMQQVSCFAWDLEASGDNWISGIYLSDYH